MKLGRIPMLLILAFVVGCGKPASDASKQVELHFRLTPAPRVLCGAEETALPELKHFVTSRKETVAEWTVYLPDGVPVDTAIALFGQFEETGCLNVSVYAEDATGDWPKRDIGVEVGPRGPVRVVTEFVKEYPEPLRKYTGKHFPENLLVAECELGDMAAVLRPLLAISGEKHVRLQEVGGLEGMPAKRYVEVLTALEDLGVETVSFYGVYVE